MAGNLYPPSCVGRKNYTISYFGPGSAVGFCWGLKLHGSASIARQRACRLRREGQWMHQTPCAAQPRPAALPVRAARPRVPSTRARSQVFPAFRSQVPTPYHLRCAAGAGDCRRSSQVRGRASRVPARSTAARRVAGIGRRTGSREEGKGDQGRRAKAGLAGIRRRAGSREEGKGDRGRRAWLGYWRSERAQGGGREAEAGLARARHAAAQPVSMCRVVSFATRTTPPGSCI